MKRGIGMLSQDELITRARKIKLMAFDVDGVMTDGSVTYDENGVEYIHITKRINTCWDEQALNDRLKQR